MAESNLELPKGYVLHPDEHLEMPAGYSLATASPKQAEGFMQGLTTNDPTKGVGAYVGRNLPRAIGGVVGAMAGTGVASIPTAGIGGAAGEAVRQTGVSLAGNNPASMAGASNTMNQITMSGNEQAAGQGAVLGAGAAIKAAGPTIMEAFPRIAERYGSAALKGASTAEGALSTALPQEEVSAAYQAFEQKAGLRGMVADIAQSGGAPLSASAKMQHIFDVGQRLVNKESVDPQELYLASQYASNLKLMSKFASPPPEMVGFEAAISQGQELANKALEDIYPEYQALRTSQFLTKAKDAFASALPLNRNMSVNKLGLTSAIGAAGALAGYGESRHDDRFLGAAALPLLAMSPMAYGAAIKAAPAAAGILRTGAGQTAQSLADYYQQARQQPRNPAPPLAPR